MTAEGRLSRGKANYEAGKFLNNSETQEYIKSIKQPEAPKPKEEKKDGKPKSR